jgi:protein transport protein SEC24
MQDDQHNRSGIFYTNQKGLVPPLVTTNFITQDQGNANPRYIRSSMYNIPATIDMMKQVRIPHAVTLLIWEVIEELILYPFLSVVSHLEYLTTVHNCMQVRVIT